MDTSVVTSKTIDQIRLEMEKVGFTRTAVDRHEHGPIAVETGYVYGEITTKIWHNDTRGRNTGKPLQTIRGIGTAYVDDVLEAINYWYAQVANVAKSRKGSE